jgi:lipopolysaccharide/colanic/teichoic acid biosynthesis glycosyltransferase
MTNPQRSAVITLLKLFDLAVVVVALALAVSLMPTSDPWPEVLEMRVKVRNLFFIAGYLGYWHLVLRSFGLYRSHRLTPASQEWRDLAAAVVVSIVPLYVLRHVLHFEFANPPFVPTFWALTMVGLGIERRLLRRLAHAIRMRGRNLRNAIIVGGGDDAFDMVARLARRSDLGYAVVDVVQIDADAAPVANGNGNGHAHAGNGHAHLDGNGHASGNGHDAGGDRDRDALLLERISRVIASHPIDEVFVVLRLDVAQPLVRAIVALCEEQGITVRLLSGLVDLMLAKAQLDELDGRPVITIFTGPPDSADLVIKRAIDVGVSLVALALLAPLFAMLALLIKLDSSGPVLFVQERVGLNRRRFRALKFRTMVPDAEERQAALESLNEAQGPVFKIRNDPRVTRVGRWLRQLSLDELPQLWNVFRGDMSLVGPRPLPIRDVERIDVTAHKRRFSVKPGITCLWQINGRVPEFDYWIKADMEYIDNWSLGLDFRILMKTIPAVLSRRGAY